MAILKPVAKKAVATIAKKPVATVAKKDGFEIMDMGSIQLVPKGGGGGGKALSPFAAKVFGLLNGQGIKISEEKYNAGKGVASLYAGAKRRGIKLRVRKDVNGQLWLFRVSEEDEAEAIERDAQRAAEREESAAAE